MQATRFVSAGNHALTCQIQCLAKGFSDLLKRSPSQMLWIVLAISLVASLTSFACADDFPPELVLFKQYGDKPIFTAAGSGTWEVKIRERGWIHLDPKADGSDPANPRYRLWYTGYNGVTEGVKHLGYATSKDGVSWTRLQATPIYDQHWVEDMIVLPHKNVWHMFAEGKDDLAQLLTSPDGIKWHREGQLDVRKKNGMPIEPGPYGTPTVWLENGVWHLFYERNDLGIWLATTQDLKVWTNVSDDPVIRPGQGIHDRDMVAMNQIVRHKGRYYAYYHGSARGEAKSLWTTNVAVSDDLRTWHKYAHNPIVPRELNRSSGIIIPDGDRFRLYTMHPEVWLHVAP